MSVFEHTPRTSLQVTFSVWKALFIREALQRTMAERFSWFWMIAEPIAQVIMFVGIREVIGSMNLISGAEYVPWLVVGMMTFFVFREGMMRSIGAIEANKGLFSYRQVKPVDTVLMRGVVEGILKTFIFILLIVGLEIVDISSLPSDPLFVITYWFMAWVLGLSIGLLLSAANALILEVGIIIRMITLPLYILSGVMIPVNFLPHYMQEILLLNPVLHLIELMRASFFDGYRPINNISIEYVLWWITIPLALGLAMHLRFEFRIKAA